VEPKEWSARFAPQTIPVGTTITTHAGEENTELVVSRSTDGFRVQLWDNDTGLALPSSRSFRTFAEADEYARFCANPAPEN
jgi:hypothetical protein